MTIELVPLSQVEQGSAYIATGDGKAFPITAAELKRAFDAVADSEDDKLISTGEAAQILGLSPKTVDRILDSGQIPFIRYSPRGRRKVSRKEVVAFRERSRRRGQEKLEAVRSAAQQGHLYDTDYSAYLSSFE